MNFKTAKILIKVYLGEYLINPNTDRYFNMYYLLLDTIKKDNPKLYKDLLNDKEILNIIRNINYKEVHQKR